MTYKHLKRQQVTKLRKQREFVQMVTAIRDADLTAFGDVRNLLFERELGTNILSESVTGQEKDAEDMLTIAEEVKHQIAQPDILMQLATVPDTQGSNLSLKVLGKTTFEQIERFFTLV